MKAVKPQFSRDKLWHSISNVTFSDIDQLGVLQALTIPWIQRIMIGHEVAREGIGSLIARSLRSWLKLRGDESSKQETILIAGALDKPHYHEPAISIAKEIDQAEANYRILYGVPPWPSDGILLPDGVLPCNLHTYPSKFTLSSFSCFLKIWKAWKNLRPSSIPDKWLRYEKSEILWACTKVEAYRSMLTKIRCSALVVMNEQHLPWSLVVSAAKSLNIPVHHILHGSIAAPSYTPFQANFLWADFEFARKAMIDDFGVDTEKIKCAPGITVKTTNGSISTAHSQTNMKTQKRRLLFLSQWNGWAQYNQSIFRDGLIAVAKVMAERTENWEVWLRAHPYDNSKMQQDAILEFTSRGVPVVCVDNNQPLGEQASHCDIVGTVFSTGVFEAIHCGVPAFVFWNEDLKKSHGVPSLPDEWLVRKEVDLERIVDNLSDGDLSIEGVRESLHVDEWDAAPHKVVKGILESIS